MAASRTDDKHPILFVEALGRFQLRVGDQSINHALPIKSAALIAYLADVGQPVQRSEVAGMLWSDMTEERARANLRLSLTKIRRIIPEHVHTDRRKIWLNSNVRYDVSAMEMGDVEATLDRYDGDFLVDVQPDGAALFGDWAEARRYSLRATALLRLNTAAERAHTEQDWMRSLTVASRVLEIEPWNELAHRHVIEALSHTSGRTAALAQFDHCVQVLISELGVEPEPATQALGDLIRDGHPSGTSHVVGTDPNRQSSLPPELTPFVGRRAELKVINNRLSAGENRLVTIVGPGGVGKTRLAISAARNAGTSYETVIFAPLAGVQTGAEMISMLVGLVVPDGVDKTTDPFEQLLTGLGVRRTLLILDNLEHLIDDVVDEVSTVIASCPNTTMLVTSRQAIGVSTEDVIEVGGLPIRNSDESTADASEAVRLFVDRAYRINKSFSLSPDNAADIVRLCQLVEGMPLHLELAAARVATMSVDEIVDTLSLTAALPGPVMRDIPERHSTFRAVFEQSWRLLDERERRCAGVLSVTKGGFDRDAARALVGDPVIASAIARKSLLVEEGDGRFRFHELIRQSAAAQMSDVERRDSEVRHAVYYLGRLNHAAADLVSSDAIAVSTPLLLDLDNIRIAWARALEFDLVKELGDASNGLIRLFEIAGQVYDTADMLGNVAQAFEQGRLTPSEELDEASFLGLQAGQLQAFVTDDTVERVGDRALLLLDGLPERNDIRAWVLLHQAQSSLLRVDHDRAQQQLSASTRLAQSVGNDQLDAWIMALTGRLHSAAGRFDEATEALRAALAVFVRLGDIRSQVQVHSYLAPAYAEQYRIWEAYEADRHALELATAIGSRQKLSILNANLAASLILLGDYETARRLTETAIDIVRRSGHLLLEGYLLVQRGECLLGLGDVGTAERDMTEGVALARRRDDTFGYLYSLVPWSRYLVDAGRFDEARMVAEDLIDIAEARDADHFALTGRMIAARVDAANHRTETAEHEALSCWQLIHGESVLRLPWPIDTRLDIFAVFGPEHEVGSQSIAEAREIHRSTAKSISDPMLRRTFVDQQSTSRALALLANNTNAPSTK